MEKGQTKVIGVVAALVVLTGLTFRLLNREPAPREPGNDGFFTASPPPTSGAAMARTQPAAPPRATAPDADDAAGVGSAPGVSREQIEEYLTRHHRSAASLLAAFHASRDGAHPSGDIQYLREAAANFPGDPRVQLAVLAHDVFPEDRRKWIDAFKTASPDNSLGNYLSAREHFQNQQADAAIHELQQASAKSEYADFAMESYLGAEEIFRELGRTQLEANTAAMTAMAADLLPQLSNMKGIAQAIVDAQARYADSGDAALMQSLSQMGLQLAGQLTGGEGGRFLISRLTGDAAETLVLRALDPDTRYDFLGGQTAAQRLEGLSQQRHDFRALMRDFNGAFLRMSPAEQVSYVERVKVYGEVAAMRWLQERSAATGTRTGE